jgi:hypothetical protein
MQRKRKISEHHESDYSFMRRCADRMNLPWQAIVSNQVYVDLIREARYSGMSISETVSYFKEMISEKKDIEKKTKVQTPGQSMDISKRSKEFPTPPCEMDK